MSSIRTARGPEVGYSLFSLLFLSSSILTFILSATFSACTPNSASSLLTSASASPSPTPVNTAPAAGSRAAKIIFQDTTGGSFNPPSAGGGTPTTPGSGLQAVRIFNADGTVLSSGGPSSSTWPQWLSSFELGVSGSSNGSSPNGNCANFASASESSVPNCIIGTTASCPAAAGVTPAQCGAPAGQFRISEVDCSLNNPTSGGNGGPGDGVYFRATFNRNSAYLGSYENILATLEYTVSDVNPAPSNPLNCFANGQFSPEGCSDFVWRAYLKHSATEYVQPYLLLIPPAYASVLGPNQVVTQSGGTMVSSKQFIVPLASDQNLTVLQVSRVSSNFPGNSATCGTPAYNLWYYCTAGGAVSGSTPLCAGVVLYSLTLIRI